MKNYNTIYFLILAGILGFSQTFCRAEAGLAMVYDPDSKKYFVGANAKFTLKDTDQGAPAEGIEISLDNGDFQAYSGSNITFTEEGKHTLKFRARNPVSNWSPVQYTEVFCDMTPPTTEVRFVDNRAYTNGGLTYIPLNGGITLAAQDNLSGVAGVEFSWDGDAFKPYTKAIIAEHVGSRKLYYRSIDRVANLETTKILDFVVDATPPISSLKHAGPDVKQTLVGGKSYLTASDAVAFSVDAIDDVSKVKDIFVSTDNKPFQPYQKPIYFLQEGAHTLKYYAIDNAGNKEDSKSVAIYTISTPPRSTATPVGQIVNTGGINYATRTVQVKLQAKDNAIGLEKIEVRVDDESNFRTYLEPIRFDRPGQHTVHYRAVDRVGNQEPSRSYTLTIQDVPPETSIETAQPVVNRNGVNYSAAPNVITLNVKNNPVGVAKTLVSLNDQKFQLYQGPLTLTADRKVYKIVYQSIDKLGNEEPPKTTVYHMVGTIPVVNLFVSDGKSQEEKLRTHFFDQPGSMNPGIAPKERAEKAEKAEKPADNRGTASKSKTTTAPSPLPPQTPKKDEAAPAPAPASAKPATNSGEKSGFIDEDEE